MLDTLVAFWRLSRPVFLLGGIALYALGVGTARAQGCTIEPEQVILGQLFVTSLQLMTHYLNEYWDIETDRLNQSRTMFSGGSGVLATGHLPRGTGLVAAIVCLTISVVVFGLLLVLGDASPLALGIMLTMFLGAFFYSSPPLMLAGSGGGEVTASIVVAGLVPALGLVLNQGRLSTEFLLVVAPLLALHYAMLLVFEFPDEPSDREAGKRTIIVRLRHYWGSRLHNASLLFGVGLLIVTMPPQAAIPVVIVVILSIRQLIAVSAFARGQNVSLGRMTLLGVAIFALAVTSVTAVVWLPTEPP